MEFQFLDGSIDSVACVGHLPEVVAFQFLDGSIDSIAGGVPR